MGMGMGEAVGEISRSVMSAHSTLSGKDETDKPKLLGEIRRVLRLEHHSSRTVQELPGHKNVSTTMIPTRVLNKPGLAVRSPVFSTS